MPQTAPPNFRIDWRSAWRALRRLRANPDATEEVFVVLRALTGKCGERAFRRFRETATGRAVLAEKRDLLQLLQNRAALCAMPEGSLGREYAAFTEREQISADGLVGASENAAPAGAGGRSVEEVRAALGEDRMRFFNRRRDCHDLQHVLTGYGRDLRGELALLAFGLAQQWHHGVALIVGDAFRQTDAETRALVRAAWRRGKAAAWLDGGDWETLLHLPLADARARLGVGPPPRYEAVRSDGAPALAAA